MSREMWTRLLGAICVLWAGAAGAQCLALADVRPQCAL